MTPKIRDGKTLRRQLAINTSTREKSLPAMSRRDRKSTRLNSSHSQISYAVFCLKKKKKSTNSPSLSLSYPSVWLLLCAPSEYPPFTERPSSLCKDSPRRSASSISSWPPDLSPL